MNQTIFIRKCSDINVFFWFVAAYFGLYLIPFIILVHIGELNLEEPQTREHLTFTIIYIISYLAAGGILWVIHKSVSKPTKYLSIVHIANIFEKKRQVANTLATSLGWFSVLIIAIYYTVGGYKKILLLGSNIDAWNYRIIGYDDTSRILTAFLEVARRILMPYAILTKLALAKYQYSKNKLSLVIFITAAIFGAIVNLDRGPIFLNIMLFFFFYFFSSNTSAAKKFAYFILFALIVGMIGSIVTYLQYNKFDFDLLNIYQGSFAILIDRVMMDPVRMAEVYAFGNISLWDNPLYLKYSRLGALFGAQYVGTEYEFSMYVAPVGLFGDVWRNFGMPGAVYIGLCHGFIFKIFSEWLKKSNFVITLPVYFLLFSLILYLFYGGIFSQGPFALLFIIFILAWFNRITKRSTVWHKEIFPMRA